MSPFLKIFLTIACLFLHIRLADKNYWEGIMIGFHAFLVLRILLVTVRKATKEAEYKDIAIYMAKNNKSCITFDEIDKLSKTL